MEKETRQQLMPCFIRTKQIGDTKERRNAIRKTYEEVCRFMRYYHGLAKKTERD